MSAPWEKTRYAHSFAGVGFDKPIEVVDCDALPPLVPFDSERESVTDGLVGLVAGTIEHRRVHDCYGPLNLTPEQRDEMTRAIAANILAEFKLERLP